jgi:hypothetical protein
MSDTVDALILDLLEWIGPAERPYAEVMDAWRTSCPRLPVWEEANSSGYVARRSEPGRGELISVSEAGWLHLEEHRASSGPDRRPAHPSVNSTRRQPDAVWDQPLCVTRGAGGR